MSISPQTRDFMVRGVLYLLAMCIPIAVSLAWNKPDITLLGGMGALFALSFDTVSQAALFAVAGVQAGGWLHALGLGVAFMGGIAGQLYRQFAITVAIAVVLSGVVALTLTPALCALLLKRGVKSLVATDTSAQREMTERLRYQASHDELKSHLQTFLMAYNFARRLKALKGLTPYEFICKTRENSPDKFKTDSDQFIVGLNS